LTIESLHLPPVYLKMVRDILRAHLPDAEIWAYGSRVNGDFYEASDLDLVARQPDDLTRRQTRLYEAIEAFSESNLPIIVQIVDWASIPAEFRNEIIANHAVIALPQGAGG